MSKTVSFVEFEEELKHDKALLKDLIESIDHHVIDELWDPTTYSYDNKLLKGYTVDGVLTTTNPKIFYDNLNIDQKKKLVYLYINRNKDYTSNIAYMFEEEIGNTLLYETFKAFDKKFQCNASLVWHMVDSLNDKAIDDIWDFIDSKQIKIDLDTIASSSPTQFYQKLSIYQRQQLVEWFLRENNVNFKFKTNLHKQRVFVMIKPDGVKRNITGEIITRFQTKGFNIIKMRQLRPDIKLIESHYKEHFDKDFYSDLIDFMTSGDVVGMIMEGNIECARAMLGQIYLSSSGTIRGDYACTVQENIVHCSDSKDSAKREVNLWAEYL